MIVDLLLGLFLAVLPTAALIGLARYLGRADRAEQRQSEVD